VIKQFKYQHSASLVEFLWSQLALHISSQEQWPNFKKDCVITAIPMHWYKQYWIRGYNQAELLAKYCATSLGVPYHKLLYKKQWTFSQASKTKQWREETLTHAFSINKIDITHPKHILLIDDVMTTGSTLSLAARILKQNYPKATIRGAVLARNG
jgi:ComF family protein